MQSFRRWLVALVVLALATSVFAAPQREQDVAKRPRQRDVQQKQKPQNPWTGLVAKILDDLQDKLSIPPG